MKRVPVILYRVLEVAVMLVTYLVLGLILYSAVVWVFS
jgi:hypothetical protein